MPNTALHRTVPALVTNKSGGALAQGDVVIVSTVTALAVTTTTTGAYVNTSIGVVLEPNGIANDASGLVAFAGWVPKVNLNTAATVGQLLKTHTVAKQATPHDAPLVAGDFGEALQASATPQAILYGFVNQGGGGGVATDAIWDAKGDLAGGTGANTAARLAVGTNGQVLTADSAEVTGMKWAASAGGGGGESFHPFLLMGA